MLQFTSHHFALELSRNRKFWKGCKPNFVFPAKRQGENHLSQQPVPGTRTISGHGAGSSVVPYLALHPMGFSVPPRLRLERWAFTPPFHPYPALSKTTNESRIVRLSPRERFSPLSVSERAGRFIFCGTIRWDASRHRLPRVSHGPLSCVGGYRLRGIAPFGVRTFLPRLAPGAILRLSKIARNIAFAERESKWVLGEKSQNSQNPNHKSQMMARFLEFGI